MAALSKKVQYKVDSMLWDIVEDDWNEAVSTFITSSSSKVTYKAGRGVYSNSRSLHKEFSKHHYRKAEKVADYINKAARDWYEATEDAISNEFGKDVWNKFGEDERQTISELGPIFAGEIIELLLQHTQVIKDYDDSYVGYYFDMDTDDMNRVMDEIFEDWLWDWSTEEYIDNFFL